MYQRQFGLEQNPFGTAASGDQVYTGTRRDKAVANLKIGLSKTDAVVALTGPAGVGKSTLALRAVEAASQQTLTAIVAPLAVSGDDLLELLIAEFGINSEANTAMARFQDLRCFFAEQAQEDCRLFILVEDAVLLGVDNLRLLNALTAADPRGYTGANLVLMGEDDLLELLHSESLARLQQRIRTQQTLGAFDAQETADYISHRIAQAGGVPQDFLDGNVGLAVFQSTQGVARVVDNLMDTALCFAFSRKQATLLPAMVQKVARSIYGLPTDTPIEPAETVSSENSEPAATPAAAEETHSAPEAVAETAAQEAEVENTPADTEAETVTANDDAPVASQINEAVVVTSTPVTGDLPTWQPPQADVVQAATPQPADTTSPDTATPEAAEPTAAEPAPEGPTPVVEDANPAVEAVTPEATQPPAETPAEAIPVENLNNLADVETAVSASEAAQAPVTATFDSPQPELAEVSPQPTPDAAVDSAPVAVPVNEVPTTEAPGADNPIPVLEDAIELALMDQDASVIAEALAAEPPAAPTPETSDAQPPTESTAPTPEEPQPDPAADGTFEDWAASVAQAASLEELDAQIAETLFGSADLESLSEEISTERQAAKPIEERSEEAGSIVPNNVAGGGLG